jgi:hypothetical protein
MDPLFPPWSNSVLWLALGLGAAALVGLPALAMVWVRTPYQTGMLDPPEQPVEFDHRHHVTDDGIDCRYCHLQVEKGAMAGIPPTEVCMNCHAQIWSRSERLEPVRRSWETGEPIPWRRVHRLADFVYFDHSVHVNGGVGCPSCHGRVDRMARVYAVAPLTMGWCLDCHRDPGPHLQPPRDDVPPAPTNCTACHR